MSNVPTGVTNSFTANTKAVSSQVNTNFTDVKNWHSTFTYDLKNGTVYLQTSAKSADYTVLDTDGINTILMTSGASNRTVTLPTAADNTGRILTVIKVDSGAGTCILDGEGAETVGGSATYTLTYQYESITIQCDGTAWHVKSRWHRASSTAQGTVSSFVPVITSAVKTVSSADYTVLTADGYDVILVTTGNSDRTITLPAAASNAGRKLSIVKVDSGTGFVLIDGNSSETIDGQAIIYIQAQYDKCVIACDGTNWYSEVRAPEYASNSDTTDSTDTTTFAYGPAGSAGILGATALTQTRAKRVRFKTNTLPGDTFSIEVDVGGSGYWFTLGAIGASSATASIFIIPFYREDAQTFGMCLYPVSATDVDVRFGRYAYPSGSTFASAGTDYNNAAFSGSKWRVKRYRAH